LHKWNPGRVIIGLGNSMDSNWCSFSAGEYPRFKSRLGGARICNKW
jgi:hypothetical protein